MDDADLPACSLEDWQADMRDTLSRIETQVMTTNGRVGRLEGRMQTADVERATLEAQIEAIRVSSVSEIESAIERVLARRETDADAAAYRALKESFGDPESSLGKWAAVTRLFETTASKIWLTLMTGAAAAGMAIVAERLF